MQEKSKVKSGLNISLQPNKEAQRTLNPKIEELESELKDQCSITLLDGSPIQDLLISSKT